MVDSLVSSTSEALVRPGSTLSAGSELGMQDDSNSMYYVPREFVLLSIL